MNDKIARLFYPLLLVSGMLTGWISQLGGELVIVFLIFSLTSYSIYSFPFRNHDLIWISILTLFLFFVILMTLKSDSVIGAKAKIFQLMVTISYFICGLNCLRKNSLRSLCDIGIIYTSLIVSAYAYVFFIIAGADLSTFKLLSVEGDNRVISDYLLLATILYPLLFLKIFSGKRDLYLILILLSSLFCISLGGRGPFIFLLIIIFIVIIKDVRKNFKVLSFGVTIGIVLFYYTGIFDVFLSRLDSISGGDISLEIRFREYYLSLEYISANVIVGSGVGMSGIILGYGDVYAYPHNVILESWLELGIIGLIAISFIYVFFSTYWLFCREYKAEFWVSLICLFYLLNALKSGSIYEQRYLAFYAGIFIYLRKCKFKNVHNMVVK